MDEQEYIQRCHLGLSSNFLYTGWAIGTVVGASVSCYTRCGLVWLRSECNLRENAVVGMYNVIFAVK